MPVLGRPGCERGFGQHRISASATVVNTAFSMTTLLKGKRA